MKEKTRIQRLDLMSGILSASAAWFSCEEEKVIVFYVDMMVK